MADTKELRFRIDAWTPDTLPMARLAEYLVQLAQVLGEERAVHLVRLEEGSMVAVSKVDVEALPKVRARTLSVRRGNAPISAIRAYRSINKMLRDDNGVGVIQEDGAEIIRFPGREESEEKYNAVTQQGSIDGEVVRVGGINKMVPIMLQAEGKTIPNCWATREIAKQLGSHLFEPVRLFGTGRWERTVNGTWNLDAFRVDRFDSLNDEPLSSVLTSLRALGGDWGDAALEDLDELRHGPSEKPNGGL